MKRSIFSEEHVIAILKKPMVGMLAADVCRRRGMSSVNFDMWKAQFGGLEVSEAKRLRRRVDELAILGDG